MRLRENTWFVGFLIFIGLLVLLDIGIATRQDSGWWAAWGQWIGGIGSIAAAAVAVWIAVIGWQKSDKQFHEQARRQEALQEHELASKVGAWIDREDLVNLKLMVVNSGPLPVYEVHLTFIFPNPATDVGEWFKEGGLRKTLVRIDTLGPTAKPYAHHFGSKMLMQFVIDLVQESFDGPLVIPVENQAGAYQFARGGETSVTNITAFGKVEVSFSDSNGLRWTRTQDGKLKPYEPLVP